MRAHIVTTFIGCFAVDENTIIAFKQFPKDPMKIAEKLKNSETNIIEEEKQIIEELTKKGYKEFVFNIKKTGAKIVEPNNKAEKFIKENLRKFALEKKFVKDQIEFNQLLSKISLELAKTEMKKAVGRDNLVIQSINAVDELDKMINILVERLREFYGLHFPEMDRIVDNHKKYAKIVQEFGFRWNIEDPELKQFSSKSAGADLKEEDMKAIQLLAEEILRLYKLREDLSKYLEKVLKEIAPNFTELAGPTIAAKMIAKAGGLEKLSKMSSSAIQLIGAEKSLFRFMRGKGKPPRFGILFHHPLVLKSHEKKKGKVARLLSSKLSLAIKTDFYSGKNIAIQLKKDLEEKLKKIL